MTDAPEPSEQDPSARGGSGEPAPDPLSVHINADARQIWLMLREPARIAQWHGWEHPGLETEIIRIYFTDVVEHPEHRRLRTGTGDEFELTPDTDGTWVRLHRAGDSRTSSGNDAEETEEWASSLQQLRFALERHPNVERRTGYFSGIAPDAVSIRTKLGIVDLPPAGTDYAVDVTSGVRLEGKVWYRTEHQLGLTVASYAEHGDGLLILADQPGIEGERPAGGARVCASMYGLGARALREIWDRWESFRTLHYPDSAPLTASELKK